MVLAKEMQTQILSRIQFQRTSKNGVWCHKGEETSEYWHFQGFSLTQGSDLFCVCGDQVVVGEGFNVWIGCIEPVEVSP